MTCKYCNKYTLQQLIEKINQSRSFIEIITYLQMGIRCANNKEPQGYHRLTEVSISERKRYNRLNDCLSHRRPPANFLGSQNSAFSEEEINNE